MLGVPQLFEERPWPASGASSPPQSPAAGPPVKRGRGRPRKHPLPEAKIRKPKPPHARRVYPGGDSPSSMDALEPAGWSGEAAWTEPPGWGGEYWENGYATPYSGGYAMPDDDVGTPPGSDWQTSCYPSPNVDPQDSAHTLYPGTPYAESPAPYTEFYKQPEYTWGPEHTQHVPRLAPTLDQSANKNAQWHVNPALRRCGAKDFYAFTGYEGAPDVPGGPAPPGPDQENCQPAPPAS